MTNIKWTYEKLQEESLKYKTRTEFAKKSKCAYERAHKMGIFEEICVHMPKHVDQSGENSPTFKWTLEKIQKEASKYVSRERFKIGSRGAYYAALRNGILDRVCAHMEYICYPWSEREVIEEALKYKNRLEFQKKSKGAYNHAWTNGFLDKACAHMKKPKARSGPSKWTVEALQIEASKYETRVDFLTYSPSAYSTCVKRKLLNTICFHMKRNGTTSVFERELTSFIKGLYPSAKTLKCRKISIKNRPYIRGFDIDIYIPELKLGIEFDGKYYHSFEGLKRSRPDWPDKDLRAYHEIKDAYFVSIGVTILHIKEQEWLSNKSDCIKRCLDFLKSSD